MIKRKESNIKDIQKIKNKIDILTDLRMYINSQRRKDVISKKILDLQKQIIKLERV